MSDQRLVMALAAENAALKERVEALTQLAKDYYSTHTNAPIEHFEKELAEYLLETKLEDKT